MIMESHTFSDDQIRSFASSEQWGAGNFITFLHQQIGGDYLVFDLDVPFALADGATTLTLTLQQIVDTVNAWACYYQSLGITPKDPVGLHLTDTIDYFIHYLALNRIGAIPACLNGNLTLDIVAGFLRTIGARKVVTGTDTWQTLQPVTAVSGHRCDPILYDQVQLPAGGSVTPYRHQPNDPVLLGHTSGTTGIPKAVQFNHLGFSFGVKQSLTRQVGKRILNALPHSHAAAISIIMSGVMRGARFKIQNRKDPESILAAIAHFKPDLFVSFSKVYVDLCRYDLSEYDLSSISYWLSTGDANHEPHIRKLMRSGSHQHKGKTYGGSLFIDNLGSSEFGFAAFRNIYRPDTSEFNRCIGRPFDWVEAAVLSAEGDPLPPDQIGYLGVKSKSVTAGYWNNTLLTEKNRLGGFWLTGDLAYRSADGCYFHVDRISDKIETSTGTLYSCQAEELVLKQFPEVFDCSVFAFQDGDGACKAAISVELLDDDNQDSLLDRINDHLLQTGWPQITRILFESAHTNTGVTGKKLKRVMRNQHSGEAHP